MRTLEFYDKLTLNKFARNNDYSYSDKAALNIYFEESSNELPFIMRALDSKGNKIHDNNILQYSSYTRQLRGRVLSSAKIAEVLDSAKMPLYFHIGTKNYLIGKGFLAEYKKNGNIEILFIATAKKEV